MTQCSSCGVHSAEPGHGRGWCRLPRACRKALVGTTWLKWRAWITLSKAVTKPSDADDARVACKACRGTTCSRTSSSRDKTHEVACVWILVLLLLE